MANAETLLNAKLADALHKLRRKTWQSVDSESLGYLSGRLQPDVLIRVDSRRDAIIETEIKGNPEYDAVKRLRECIDENKPVSAVAALNWPVRFRKILQPDLIRAIMKADDLRVSVHQHSHGKIIRTPERESISMNLRNLAALIDHIAHPVDAIDQAARILTAAAQSTAEQIERHRLRSWPGIEETMHQKEDARVHRMAGSIIANALLFQGSISGMEGPGRRRIRTSQEMLQRGNRSRQDETLDEWAFILTINYWPIFEIARRLIGPLEAQLAGDMLERLAEAARAIRDLGAHASQDFTGLVFQRLIADRKLLATFYTLPASAEFLAELTMPRLPDEQLRNIRIADFACGTGTLLQAACRKAATRILENTDATREEIHKDMMERMATGLDVLPPAVHLTATLLSGTYPDIPYEKTNIHLMAYGKVADLPGLHIGSLGMLSKEPPFSIGGIPGPPTETTKRSMAGQSGDPRPIEADDASFDWVVMNPPFTRNTNHAAERAGIPMPAFAGMDTLEGEQRVMTENLRQIYKKRARPYAHHGNAGLSTPFMDLAQSKLKPGGVLSMILPLSLANAQDWTNARAAIARWFTDVKIVAIRQGHPEGIAFSSSTGMGECILTARKRDTQNGPRCKSHQTAEAIVLHEPPRVPLQSLLVAQKLRVGFPGNSATTFEFEIHEDGYPWSTVTTDDLELLQMAAELKNGRLNGFEIPMTTFGEIGNLKPYKFSINGNLKLPGGLHQGPFDKNKPVRKGQKLRYHSLWRHNHKLERALTRDESYTDSLPPREYGSPKLQRENLKRIRELWKLRSHIHWNADFQFNAQATACIHTEKATLGGRAWPSCHFHNPAHAIPFLLWMNSTLGCLSYWHQSNRQQLGRGSIHFKAAAYVPCFDFRTLSDGQLDKAEALFRELKRAPMLPLHQMDQDANRKILDERFYREVLNLPDEIHEPECYLGSAREKLAREPSVRGTKGE